MQLYKLNLRGAYFLSCFSYRDADINSHEVQTSLTVINLVLLAMRSLSAGRFLSLKNWKEKWKWFGIRVILLWLFLSFKNWKERCK